MKCKDCNYTDCPCRSSDAQKECVFSVGIVRLPDEWQGVRIQAAIAAMQGLVANPNLVYGSGEEKIDFIKRAIRYANALVEELKKK